LFLDVDGVLNRGPGSAQGLESDKVDLLARIVQECDPSIVISSSWRENDDQLMRLIIMLQDIGGRFAGITPFEEGVSRGGIHIAKPRHMQIEECLSHQLYGPGSEFRRYAPYERVVILDDEIIGGNMAEHWIQTETRVGLTEEIADKVIAALVPLPTPKPPRPERLPRCNDEEL
jgi:hypothetical protein